MTTYEFGQSSTGGTGYGDAHEAVTAIAYSDSTVYVSVRYHGTANYQCAGGFRFLIDVPVGTTITNAYLKLTNYNTGQPRGIIRVEGVPNPAIWSSSASPLDRWGGLSGGSEWNWGASVSAGTQCRTDQHGGSGAAADITAAVQAVIDHASYDPEDDAYRVVAVYMKGDASANSLYQLCSLENTNTSQRPILVIEYESWPTANLQVGVSLPGVFFPAVAAGVEVQVTIPTPSVNVALGTATPDSIAVTATVNDATATGEQVALPEAVAIVTAVPESEAISYTTHTVKASGGDYTSLNAALNAIGTAVLPGDVIVTYRTSDTTTISVAGKSADPPVTIRPATPAENGGVALDAVVGSASNDSTYSACSGITWDCTQSSSRIRFDSHQSYTGCSRLKFSGDLSSSVGPTWTAETGDTGTLWFQYGVRIQSGSGSPVDDVEFDGVRVLHRGSRNSTGQVAFKLDGTAANNTSGVWSTNLVIRNCDIGHYAADGINLQGFSDVVIEDCHIHDLYSSYPANDVHIDGIQVMTGERVTIRRCYVHHVLFQGIWVKATTTDEHENTDHLDDIVVANCLVHNTGYSRLVGEVTPACHTDRAGDGGTLIGFHNVRRALLSHTIAVDGASGAYGVSLAHNSQAPDAWSAMEVDVQNCVFDWMVIDTGLSGQSLSAFESSGRFSHRNNLQVFGSPSHGGTLVGAGTGDLTAGTDPDWNDETFEPWDTSPLLGAGTDSAPPTGLAEDSTDYDGSPWSSPPSIGARGAGWTPPEAPSTIEVLATPSASGTSTTPSLSFTGCTAGDTLIVAARLNASVTWIPPGGWTQQVAVAVDQPHVRIYSHEVATSGDVTFAGTQSSALSWDLAGWRASGLADVTADGTWTVDGDASVTDQQVVGSSLAAGTRHLVIVATAIPATAGWLTGHAATATPAMTVSHTLPRMVTAHRVQVDGTTPDVTTSWTSPSTTPNSAMAAFEGGITGVVATPAAAAATVTVPSVTATGSLSGTATPAAVAITTTAYDVTATGSGTATATPAVTTITAVVPASTSTGSAAVVTSAAPATVAVHDATATATGEGTAAPSATTITAAVPTATAAGSGSATATPPTVAITAAVPSATATGSVSGTATPGVLALTAAVPSPSVIGGGEGTASPAVVAISTIVYSAIASGQAEATAEPERVSIGVGVYDAGPPPTRVVARGRRRPDVTRSAQRESAEQ